MRRDWTASPFPSRCPSGGSGWAPARAIEGSDSPEPAPKKGARRRRQQVHQSCASLGQRRSAPSGAGHFSAPRRTLAARAEVSASSRRPDLLDPCPAARARLPLAQVDLELVLERPLRPTGVAVVVDRGALG